MMGIIRDDIPEEFFVNGNDGSPVSDEDLEETMSRVRLGEEIEG